MKKIEAIIKPFKLDELKEALTGSGMRSYQGQKRHQYHDEKPDGFLHRLIGVLGHRLRADVWCNTDRVVRDLRVFLE